MAEIPASVRDAGGSTTTILLSPYGSFAGRLVRNLRLALWRAFQHDAFGIAKGAA